MLYSKVVYLHSCHRLLLHTIAAHAARHPGQRCAMARHLQGWWWNLSHRSHEMVSSPRWCCATWEATPPTSRATDCLQATAQRHLLLAPTRVPMAQRSSLLTSGAAERTAHWLLDRRCFFARALSCHLVASPLVWARGTCTCTHCHPCTCVSLQTAAVGMTHVCLFCGVTDDNESYTFRIKLCRATRAAEL